MSLSRNPFVQGTINAEIRFHFVTWNPATCLFDDLDLTNAFGAGGFVEGWFRRPDGTSIVVPLVSITQDAAGMASYFTPDGFLSQIGTFTAHGRALIPGTGVGGAFLAGEGVFPSRSAEFEVEAFLNGDTLIHTVSPTPVQVLVGQPNVSVT